MLDRQHRVQRLLPLIRESPGYADAPQVTVPYGAIVYAENRDGGDADEVPALWIADKPASRGSWASWRAIHDRTGLWPLLLDGYLNQPSRPWDTGEVAPTMMSDPATFDAEALLADWWAGHTEPDDNDILTPEQRRAVTAPFEQRWPGLAPPQPHRFDPDQHADRRADALLTTVRTVRLGLVPADRSSDALTVAGWTGPMNHTNDTAEISAVLRSWEDRFGVRVIGAGFAELYLSVAAPPTNSAEALRVAAEHFAFCPDNVWQDHHSLVAYSEGLVNEPDWSFWWD